MRFTTHDPEGSGKKYVDEPELWLKTEDMVRNVLKRLRHQLRRGAERSRLLRPKDRRAGLERHRPRIHPRHQPGGFRRARADSALSTRHATTPRKPRSASIARRSARTSVSSASSSSITPAISRSGSRPSRCASCPSATKSRWSTTPRPSRPNCAPTVRAEIDFGNDQIKGKIQRAEQAKVHTMLVIGGRDLEAGHVSVRVHGKGNLGAKPQGRSRRRNPGGDQRAEAMIIIV